MGTYKKTLDNFTEEEYFNLRDALGKDELIGEAKGVSGQTVKLWRWERGLYLGKANRKPNMPDEERVRIIKDMLGKGYHRDVIAQKVKMKNKKSLNVWLAEKRKKGIAI